MGTRGVFARVYCRRTKVVELRIQLHRRLRPRQHILRKRLRVITQHIRCCGASDGARIAVASTGEGPPLLRAAHWLSHVEFDVGSPVWAHWLRELSRDYTYARYNQRGGSGNLDTKDKWIFCLNSA